MDSTGLLYILPGPTPPDTSPERNVFSLLSGKYHGVVVAPCWKEEGKDVVVDTKEAMGNFCFKPIFSYKMPAPMKQVYDLWKYIQHGFSARQSYDVIIAYGPFRTALAAVFLKWVLKKKLIIDVPGNPWRSFDFGETGSSLTYVQRLKRKLSYVIVPFVLKRADAVKLLYPNQLEGRPLLPTSKIFLFHDFVPVHLITPSSTDSDDRSIFFLGYPYLLKGVDVLIAAFKSIADDFPDVRLLLHGFCEDKPFFENLIGDHPRITLGGPIPRERAFQLMEECSLFVLPSRTEAMGRVLLEAMAAKKPIVASDVDGIPHYVENEVTGLLVPPDDVEALSGALKRVLSDSSLARSLAEAGFKRVHEHYSSENYLNAFEQMIDFVVMEK